MPPAGDPAAPHAQRLVALARQSVPFWQLLQAVRDSGLPNWCIGAGAVRSLVWDDLHGRPWQQPVDIDVAYFDSTDLSAAGERDWAERLATAAPGIPWELANQARVHLWYPQAYGMAVSPFASLFDALASWPETASCVGLTLTPHDDLAVLAPYGLGDLFALTVRHNPLRVSLAQYRQRLAAKRWAQRWPKLTILPG